MNSITGLRSKAVHASLRHRAVQGRRSARQARVVLALRTAARSVEKPLKPFFDAGLLCPRRCLLLAETLGTNALEQFDQLSSLSRVERGHNLLAELALEGLPLLDMAPSSRCD